MSAHSMNDEQIRYLRDVLGIQSVILPIEFEEVSVHPTDLATDRVVEKTHGDISSSRLVALFPLSPSDFPMRPEVRDLAEKMLRAMKLSNDEVYWFEFVTGNENSNSAVLDILNQVGQKPVLLFSDQHFIEGLLVGLSGGLFGGFEYGKWIQTSQGVRIMPTHSIRSLIEDQNLKRPAWVHLQSVMKVL